MRTMVHAQIKELVEYILENDKNNLFKTNDYTINLEDANSLFNSDGVFGKIVEIDNECFITLELDDTMGYSDKMHYSIFNNCIINILVEVLKEIKAQVETELNKTYVYALYGIFGEFEYKVECFSTFEKARESMLKSIHNLRSSTWVGDFITPCLSLCFDTKKYPNWEFVDTDNSFNFYVDKTNTFNDKVIEFWIEKMELK